MSQYSYNAFESFITKCIKISNTVADADNFVQIHNLANYFNAKIELRPLLVEGMLASRPNINSKNISNNKWTVFIDSETFSNITSEHFLSESINSPLPERMRNTIAHELIHTLAFHISENGIKFTNNKKSNISSDKFIKIIESETERFSPLLLIPEKTLDKYFSAKTQTVSINDLIYLKTAMGISRYVLINRLCLLRMHDKNDICYRPPLRNLAIGIGQWKGKNNLIFKDWPIFFNFDGNIIPDFLSTTNKQTQPQLMDLFNDINFYLLGGNNNSANFNTSFGTINNPGTRTYNIRCIVEQAPRTSGKEFFYILQLIN